MKNVSRENLERISKNMNTNISSLAGVVGETFEEVYANLENISDDVAALSERVPDVDPKYEYDETTNTLFFHIAAHEYVTETKTVIMHIYRRDE